MPGGLLSDAEVGRMNSVVSAAGKRMRGHVSSPGAGGNLPALGRLQAFFANEQNLHHKCYPNEQRYYPGVQRRLRISAVSGETLPPKIKPCQKTKRNIPKLDQRWR